MIEQKKKQSHLSRRGFLVLISTGLILGVGGMIWKNSRPPALAYRTVKVQKGDLNLTLLATGTVQPENRLEIKPPIAGRVEKVLVKEGQQVSKGQVLAWMSSTERAALLDAARSEGPTEVKRWEELYRPTPVVAPLPGTVILRNIEAGQTFTSNDPILVLSDRLTVKAQFDETDIAQVKLLQPAEITLDAYADHKISAKVDQIAYEAKTINSVTTYLVDLLPSAGAPDFMRSGMTANVTVFVKSLEGVLLLPTEAIRMEDKGATVLIPSPSGQPITQAIEIGASDGKFTEIIQGLKEGDSALIAVESGHPRKGNQSVNPFSPFKGGKKR